MISNAPLYLLMIAALSGCALFLVLRQKVSAWACLLVFASVFPVELGFEQSYVENGRQQAELEATHELNFVAQRLVGQLGAHLSAVEGLAAYIASNPDITQREFEAFAAAIFARQDFLINMAAAPGLVVNRVYPLAGNEEALGLNYLKTPSQRDAVVRARDEGAAVLAGPVKLVQGGVGLIGRLPVFVPGEDGSSEFWGIVSATMDAGKVFAAAGLASNRHGLKIAVRGVDGQGSRGEVFYGPAELFSTEDVILLPVPVASGNWLMAAQYPPLAGLASGVWFLRLMALCIAAGWVIFLWLLRVARNKQKFYEQQVRANEQLLQEAGKLAAVAGWKIVEQSDVLYFSEEFSSIVGMPRCDVATREYVLSLLPQQSQMELEEAVRHAFATAEPFDIELRFKREDGAHWLRIMGNPVLQNGKVVEIVGGIQDITERMEFMQTIERQATRDSLTNLPNRQQFDTFLEREILAAQRRHQRLALLFIDLDNFKSVNDNLGHSGGDVLLVEAAKRIRACTRKSDTVARLSGDEFAVILPDVATSEAASLVAEKIVSVMREPFEIYSRQVFVSASLGVAVFPDDGTDTDTLLINADQAMYEVKKCLRNDYSFFTRELQQRSEERHRLINKLALAVSERRLEVHYQPIVPLNSAGAMGCEALVRWQEDGEYISPDAFIPLAEETGLITEIDRFVMQQATLFMESLHALGLPPPALSVNISPRIFFDRVGELDRWVEDVKACSRRTDLTVEITERLLTQDTPRATVALQQLRAEGVKIAIDDFGTGYSSLSYLAKFPIDTLKVDAFFVSKIPDDAYAMTLTETILGLGRELSLHLVAEGVETAEQMHYLRERGCDSAQGYWFSRPQPAAEFKVWLRSYYDALNSSGNSPATPSIARLLTPARHK
ncbi:MAG: EAL domain-containing protein [Halioglobus sp.]|nr:EAL domain-containing protein [Halioglobus sp.]